MEDAPEQMEELASGATGSLESSRDSPSPRPLVARPESPIDLGGLEDALDFMRASSPPAGVPPMSPNRSDEERALVDDDQGDQQLDAADEIDREYPFNQLLDEQDYDFHHDLANIVDGFEDDGENENEVDPQDALYDPDFGLADEEGQHAEVAEPRFDFAPDEEFAPEPEDDPDDGHNHEVECAAFEEPELIRNAYIDAFIQKSLYGATHRALRHQLKAARRTIAAHPDIGAEDIAKMAQTIGTAEKRIGVSTNHIITTFTLCPVCKRRYSPQYIAETDNNACINPGCSGILFTMRRLASGGHRRVSGLTYPFASPIAWIKHMLTLPGISELMQTWRLSEADKEELTAPTPCEDWLQNLDVDRPIGDIHEGWGWRSMVAGLERVQDPRTGDIVDKSFTEPPIRFVSLPYGLSLSLNTDW
ncbi:hypothetical protein FS749_005190 [Ceratobasidium sp. UAMH 11750]|nr:hypothetical protein FS749_005190 [Ceratobasidium sp. UAMH 11750]